MWKLFGAGSKEKTNSITIPKYTSDPANEVNLAVALQYGTAQGILPLQKFLKEFSAKVYQPGYADFTTLVHTGNTDGWSRAVLTLCNPGEMFITEEWTYPSAVYASKPYNVTPVPIAMDSEGMRADDLYKTLAEWDEVARGAPRYAFQMSLSAETNYADQSACYVHCSRRAEPQWRCEWWCV